MQDSASIRRARTWHFVLPVGYEFSEGDQFTITEIPRQGVVRVSDPKTGKETELELFRDEKLRSGLKTRMRIEVEHITLSSFYANEVVHEINLEGEEG